MIVAINELEQRICKAIAARRERLMADLAQHVAIPTGQGHRPGLEAYRELLVQRLASLGAEIQYVEGAPRPDWLRLPGQRAQPDAAKVPPTVIAQHRSPIPQPRILLAGHIDTVHDPNGSFCDLQLLPDDRTATGPGAADMKGGIVIALHALEALAECGVDLNWTFLLNADEETGSFHSFEALRAAAQQHDVGLALEPALPDGSLVVERMGAGQFKIEVFGRSAHVGRDFTRGISAVNALAEIITKVARLSDPDRGLILNIGPLQGGQVTNAVPDYAACWGNIRFADATAAHEVVDELKRFQTPDDAMPRVVVHCVVNRPVKPFIEPVKKLAAAIKAAADDLGQPMPFGKTGGVCDGNILQDAGLPTLDTLGVRGGNLHRTDEFIEIASLVERCQLLAVLIRRIGAGEAAVDCGRCAVV